MSKCKFANNILNGIEDLYRKHKHEQAVLRIEIIKYLKNYVNVNYQRAENSLLNHGSGLICGRQIAEIYDELISNLYAFLSNNIYTKTNSLSVTAVGGYGRFCLAPYSDLDLLFIVRDRDDDNTNGIISYILYLLWDIGLKIGHATRTVTEAIELAKDDLTISTSILDARYICGNKGIFNELIDNYTTQVIANGKKEFVIAKLSEREGRHIASGGSRYLVEPNVKNSKGGLRDLHSLYWIAKFCYNVKEDQDLVKVNILNKSEYLMFKKCEDFLWKVRCHLHFITNRASDILAFEYQIDVAKRLNFRDHEHHTCVERFMKLYFLMAKTVGDITRIFCSILEYQQIAPTKDQFLSPEMVKDFGNSFKLDSSRLTFMNERSLNQDNPNFIRLFYLANKYNLTIHPNSLQLITRSLSLIDNDYRQNAEENRLFVNILTSENNPEKILRKMNEAGVLGRFIPDFGRIVAHMQFSMYHHYTVDEHLLRAIGILSDIDQLKLIDEHPLASKIIREISNRKVLFLAILLHDIAKGRQESHSIIGEEIARDLGPRLGYNPQETELVAWLVLNHLVMSDFAQKRDVNDHKTIADFASIVQSRERLKLLLILTVADIKAVGPGVWNGWKGQLLRNLYYETDLMLTSGYNRLPQKEQVINAQEELSALLQDWPANELQRYLSIHCDNYWLSIDIKQQLEHSVLLRRLYHNDRSIIVDAVSDKFTSITKITICAKDNPGLLQIITGCCASVKVSIIDAYIYTTTNNIAINTIYTQRLFKSDYDEGRHCRKIIKIITKALNTNIIPDVKPYIKPRVQLFSVKPRVEIKNNVSDNFTVIEVNCIDRIGLLYGLTTELSAFEINIHSAHIATFGERVVDVFYVSDYEGNKIFADRMHKNIIDKISLYLDTL